MNKQVLIIGFGKMGHIYARYLDKFNVKWFYYDPFVRGGLKKLAGLNDYSHIIISTPPENHHESYEKIKKLGFKGYIYVDKPIIISVDHLNVFKDKKVFCGMTERYNPVITSLKSLLNIEQLTSIKFSRYSTVPENIKTPVLFDLGIHDLDLYLYLLDFNKVPDNYDIFEKSKTCYVMSKQNNILSIFEWSHESQRRERKITVLQKDIVYEMDLIDQTILAYGTNSAVRNLYVDKDQPLRRIMRSFLNNDKCYAKLSHEFMLKILNDKSRLIDHES